MTNIIYVPQDGTIEAAVATIKPGGTIKISAGRYVLKETLLIEKPLRLEGEGSRKTVIISTSLDDLIRVKISGQFAVEGLCFQYEESEESSQHEDNTESLSSILNMPEPSFSILRIDAGIADIFNCKFSGHESLICPPVVNRKE